MEGIVLYSLLFIVGIFVCLAIVCALETTKLITIRYSSEYFFIAVVIEIIITLLVVRI